MYKLGKDESAELTEDEKKAISLWGNVLEAEPMQTLINASYDLFTKKGAVTESDCKCM